MSDRPPGKFSQMGGKCPTVILAKFEKRVENVQLSSWQIFKMGGQCPTVILANFQKQEDISLGTQMCRAWYKLNPGMTEVKVSQKQILSRYKYQIRQDKRKATLESDKVIKSWEKMCEAYRISEENIEVIDETAVEVSKAKNETYEDSPLKLEYNSDLQSRDYNR